MTMQIFSDSVKIERWDGYQMVKFVFKTGDEEIIIILPEFEAIKISNKMAWLLDEQNENS